jgi:hypothetical protein
MTIKIDKSEITQSLLNRMGALDKSTLTAIIIMLNDRIYLPDSAYTTMSDTKWLKHFRKELVEYLDLKDKIQQDNDKHMRTALANMLDAYENSEY